MTTDPFADPTDIPNLYPNQLSLVGRLCLFTPVKYNPNHTSKMKPTPHAQFEVDILVVDGKGPIVRDGKELEGDEFKGVFINADRPVKQLMGSWETKRPTLGVFNLPNPNQRPGEGNSYNIDPATAEQKNQARQYLANRTVGGAQAPASAPANDNPFAKQ